jgi:hypothetical protein
MGGKSDKVQGQRRKGASEQDLGLDALMDGKHFFVIRAAKRKQPCFRGKASGNQFRL